ncbi:MAG TPA: hypothetical protein PLD59_14385 [Tepidisphaeraceae bacterium]|nr:hypothetical protein [Tepidisphaeraceae bacterium]
MTPLTPITTAALGTPAAERAAAAEKASQLKRIERNRKGVRTADTFERAVESPDELEPIADQHHKQQRQQSQSRKTSGSGSDSDAEPPHLDVRA